jgi:flagellar motor switch protein FliN/FliY
MSSSKSSLSSSVSLVEPLPRRLQDVRCRVEVVLGTGTVSMRQCLALGRGTVIPLAQPAGADLEVLVNGIPIAQGEVVIVQQRMALRVTDLLPPPSAAALP